MTIQTIPGDLLAVEDGIIIHGCNCIGGFGSGIAGQILKKWPGVEKAYKAWFVDNPNKDRRLGDIQVLVGSDVSQFALDLSAMDARKAHSYIDQTLDELPPGLVVVNAFTQFYYGGKSQADILFADYDAISAVFARTAALAKMLNKRVYFPQIGAGLANGDWAEIERRISAALAELDDPVYVKYVPA